MYNQQIQGFCLERKTFNENGQAVVCSIAQPMTYVNQRRNKPYENCKSVQVCGGTVHSQ